MLSFIAASDLHISLKAEILFSIGPLHVSNSLVYGLISSVLIMLMMVWAARKITINPVKGFSSVIEMIVEYVTNMLTGPMGSRERAIRFAPIFGVYFIFIIFNYLFGILPIVGPTIEYNGNPVFRSLTADLNSTIALAVIAILMVQYFSIREQGGKGHLKHYFSDKPLNPINMFIGLLEVFGEFTRVISLSLRLFLNTAVGDILIVVFSSMIVANGRTPLAVLPILLFECLVAYIQAYVFTVLAGTYLGMAIAHSDHDDHHADVTTDGVESRSAHGA